VKPRSVILGLVCAAAFSASAAAGPVEDFFLKELTNQGYTDLEISYTWLGRLRIEGENGKYHRELIINPRTGEILRDVWELIGDKSGSTRFFEDDDDDDDDDQSSASGSGSQQQGSGSSGSGDGHDDDDDEDSDAGDDDPDDDDGDDDSDDDDDDDQD